MRTLLTALGVAVGVGAIVAFTTMVQGLWEAVEAAIHFEDTDLLVFEKGVAADIFSTLDEDQTRAKLTAVPGVERVVGSLWHALPVDDHPLFFTLGLRRADLTNGGKHLIRGRGPESDDEVLLGTIAQRSLGRDVGEVVHIKGQPYRVAGVFQTEGVFLNGAMIMSLPRLQDLAGKPGQVTVFQVFCTPDADPQTVGKLIEERYPELVAVGGATEYHKADQGLVVANAMIWAVSFVAIIIGSIIVTNTMWMSVLERTREIGVLRAVGWSHRQIVSTIVLEATGVGLVGWVLGGVLGIALASIATALPVAEQFLDPVFGPQPFLIGLAVAVVLSVLGALLPAWRATRISPAEALRHE